MRHNRITLCVHLVWCTWDRLPLIEPTVERSLQRLIEAEAGQMGCTVLAVNGTEDHVHVLVLLPAGLSVAALVKQMTRSLIAPGEPVTVARSVQVARPLRGLQHQPLGHRHGASLR
ncbi:MAG: IS200/IS605 family transposase [Anaerolineae bacterium]